MAVDLTTPAPGDPQAAPEARQFLGHPPGLFALFFTEMWERFSFYSMRAFLVLYMTKAMLLTKEISTEVYGAYLAFVYAAPFVGGMLADRLLGQRIAIYLGGALLALSQFMLATHAILTGQGRAAGEPAGMHALFFAALAVLSAGNGFFKPNISTIVGSLYQRTDPRRDGAFTIFYMGINIGAFLGGFSGQLAERIAWHWGFLLAGAGMLVSLVIFRACRNTLQGQGHPPSREALRRPWHFGIPKSVYIALGVLLYVPVAAYLIGNPKNVQGLAIWAAIPILGYLIWEIVRSPRDEGGRMIVLVVLCLFSMLFWAFYDLHGSTVNLFTDQSIDRRIPFSLPVFGNELTASLITGSTSAFFVIVLSIPFARLWVWLNRRRLEPSSPMKFSLGLLQLAAGYFLIYLAALQASEHGKGSMYLIFLGFLLHVTGELCLSPVGLSTITKMSPARLVGTFMGVWFLCSALGHVFGGWLGGKAEGHGFAQVFLWITLISLGASVLLFILTPLLKRLAGLRHPVPRGH